MEMLRTRPCCYIHIVVLSWPIKLSPPNDRGARMPNAR